MKSVILFFISALACISATFGADSYRFIENKNQWEKKILFQADLPSGKLFLEKNAFTFNFYNASDMESVHGHTASKSSVRQFSYQMIFNNANPNVDVNGSENEFDFNNYYHGKDPSKWATHVPIYRNIEYKEIYKNIDVRLYTSDRHLKYDYIIKPGGDISQIETQYEGLDSVRIKSGNLVLYTSMGEVHELKPVAYQTFAKQNTNVPCEYVLKNNRITFKFPQGYNKAQPLIIDPTIVFATFTGSTADNWGYTATYDSKGNGYSGGVAFGFGYPITLGAYQSNFSGGSCDVAIIKYDPAGTQKLTSTYLGGSGSEQPHSMVVDANDNLFIYGITGSTDFPLGPNAYQTGFHGGTIFSVDSVIKFPNGSDIFVSKLNSSGTQLLGSTYLGGSGTDGYNSKSLIYNYGDGSRGEIVVDATGNCFVSSCSNSSNFPVTAGAAQTTLNGPSDAVCFKLNSTLSALTWSTYIGGSSADAGYALVLNPVNNEVYITGGTISTNFPTTPGSLHTSNQGGTDGFITHLSANGSTILHSTYIGTNKYDQSYFIQLDRAKNVYIYGQTAGSYPVSPGVYKNANSGQFIHKLTKDLSTTLLSTVVGNGNGLPNISPSAFLVDECEKLYIAGWGGTLFGNNVSTSTTFGLPVTADAYQSSTNNDDFYFMVLDQDMLSLLYATFFGGPVSAEHVDGGTSRFDKQGVIYQSICGGCNGNSDMPTTTGCWSNINNSTNCNNALVKFYFESNTVEAKYAHNLDTLHSCVPAHVDFTNKSINGVTYDWDFGDGTTTTASSPSHTFTTPGIYKVRLISSNAATCNLVDTIYQFLNITRLTVKAGPDKSFCLNQNTTIGLPPASPGLFYNWSPTIGIVASTSSQTVANPASTSTYVLTATDSSGNCIAKDTVTVKVNPLPASNAGPDKSMCINKNAVIGFSGVKGVRYSWLPKIAIINFATSQPTVNPTITTSYFLTSIDSVTGCFSRDTVKVTVNPLPTTTLLPIDSACKGSVITMNAGCVGSNTYLWAGDPDISDIHVCSPLLNVKGDGTYTVTITSSFGCSIQSNTTVTSIDMPITNLAGPDTICKGDFVQLGTLLMRGYKYKWTPFAGLFIDNIHNPVARPSISTTYHLSVIDSTGKCEKKDSIHVLVNTSPLPIPLSQPICKGVINVQIANSSGLPAGLKFSWSPAATLNNDTIGNPLASPTITTTYVVTVFDPANGCRDTISSKITVNNVTGTAGPDTSICTGGTVHLGVSSNPLINTYNWTGSLTGGNPLVSPVISGSYTVDITNSINGCQKKDTINIIVKAGPAKPNPTSLYLFCNGDSKAIGIPYTPGYSYLWTPAIALSNPTNSNPVASPTTTTTYVIWVSLDSTGCMDSSKVKVSVAFASVHLTPKMLCKFDSVYINPTSVLTESYTWSPGTGLNSTSVVNPKANPLITTTYFVTITSPAGCPPHLDSLVVNVSKDTVSLAVTDTNICSTSPLNLTTLTTGGVTTYEWSYNGLFSPLVNSLDTFKVSYFTQDTSIYVRVNNGYPSGACIKSDTIRVTLDDVKINTHDTLICKGNNAILHVMGDPAFSYSWSPVNTVLGSPNKQQIEVTPEGTTTYSVKAIDQKGCEANKTLIVTVANVLAKASVGKEFIYKGENAQLFAEPFDTLNYWYLWTPVDSLNSFKANPKVSPLDNTTYKLTITEKATGCSAQSDIHLRVRPNGNCGEPDIFVPDAFTPDGDSHNDFLEVKGNYIKAMHMLIYNRWGEKVKEMFSQSDRWDGTYNGILVEPGVFVYYVEFTCLEGEKYFKKGNITVIR